MVKQKIVGLTGPTGAGKTTVSKLLAENGYEIIDADLSARRVVLPGSPCLGRIAEAFSTDILNADGTLNRRALGQLVFADNTRLKQLEAIIYPYIIKDINLLIADSARQGHKLVVLDAPTLFESGCDKLCDKVMVVIAPLTARLMRIMSRDNISYEQAMQRISSQQSDEFYVSRADYVVDNANPKPDYSDLLSWLQALADA